MQAKEALEDPGLELEERQVILKAPVKILRKPRRVLAEAGRFRSGLQDRHQHHPGRQEEDLGTVKGQT